MGISLLPKHTAEGKKGIRMFPLTGCPSASIRLLVPDHIPENPQVMSLKQLLPHSKNGSGPAV
ncbi:hypothetical protein [Anaerostipes sp.]|uniref:hypothetical protein n=1 Tax=Anaerostipes sp. TaxID=1872530 RepID=UPI0025BD9074|nr:hypothetical protein [Anaerostipes sp.]MBS7009236.1 hypothetical protein [Anaerostipes sp.]